MNLWDKSLLIRQLTVLVVALFFFSCEDETSLLGFRNPNPKFDVRFIEIPIESSVLLVDSVATDNLATLGPSNIPFNAVGNYVDPIFGTMKAETYLQLMPGSTSKLEETSIYDSVTFQMRLNCYSYGFTGEQTMKFNIHELTEKTLDLDSGRNRYYFNSTLPYNSASIGQAKVSVNYDSLNKQYAYILANQPNLQDTILMRGRLADAYGSHLFSLALNDPNSRYSDPLLFVQEVKGLVVTAADNNGILGVNPLTNFSKVTVHYHTMANGVVADTLEKSFIFSGSTYDPNFTNYSVDRSATEFSALTNSYHHFAPVSGLRGVQSGGPLLTKLDLTSFYKFADTVQAAVISSAEFVIDGIESNAGIYNHGQLMLKVMNENDQFVNTAYAADVTAMSPYVSNTTVFSQAPRRSVDNTVVIDPGYHFYVQADTKSETDPRSGTLVPATANLNYIGTENRYSGFMTLFAQDLVKNAKVNGVNNPSRINYLAVYPRTPLISLGVNRTAFNANNIKLRIYYTKPSATVKLN
jgi:hypothetical protein